MERTARGIRIRNGNANSEVPEGTYIVDVQCENCDWTGEVEIPKGTVIRRGERIGRYVRCEKCGCHTLLRCEQKEKTEEPEEPDRLAESDRLEELLERPNRPARPAAAPPQLPLVPLVPLSPSWTPPRTPLRPYREFFGNDASSWAITRTQTISE